MLTPAPSECTGLSMPAQAPEDQQIWGAKYGNGRAVPRRIFDLEKELHQYEHDMGLILIDRQEMAAKYDQLSQVYAQNKEILKREQAAHLNAIYEYEKREERIRKALCIEKQHVADLEKALHEMRSEIAEVKFVSQKNISGANSLQANKDEKSLLIKKKLSAADGKLEEANLMMSHADKKIKDIKTHQRRCEKEKLCYETEWKAQKNQLKEKEESLDEWEKRLMESQNRQVSFQRSLSGREDKLTAYDKTLKMKQEELLKVQECDINNRLHNLHAYEMDMKSKYKTLEEKEEILDDWEDRIDMKEKLSYERKRMESFHDSEKRRLKDLELELRAKYKKQMKDIILSEEAFMCDIEQQKLQNNELREGERANSKRRFDLHSQNLLNTETSPHGTGRLIDSTGHFMLLQKCSGHFRSYPSKKSEHSLEHKVSFGARPDNEALEHEEDYEPSRIYEGANDSFAFSQETPSDAKAAEKEELERVSLGGHESFSFGVTDNILKTQSGDTTSSMELDANIILNDGNGNGPEGGLHSETLNQGERLQNREGRLRSVRRTRTIQAVIDATKALISPISEEKHSDQKDFAAPSAAGIEQRVENTEVVYSDGDASGAPLRKRQQLGGTATQVPGEKHYNLRHNRVVSAATSSKTRSGEARAPKVGSKRKTEESSSDDAKGASTCGVPSALLSTELGEAAKAHESSHMNLPAEAQEVCTEESDGDGCTEESDGDDEEPPTGNDSFRRWLWIFLTT
ncbi:uncharacterized protein [Lolium perenne]|uniref:uncharacterized protein isoform X2 n=1 Tax=Lolium perenne TaxID=4522 RepID=UPI003A9A52AF